MDRSARSSEIIQLNAETSVHHGVSVADVMNLLNVAAATAMEYFGCVTPRWKDSMSYVTDADLAVQHLIVKWLTHHYPDDGIIAEEEDLRKEPVTGSRYWSIDPIDGTAAFVGGLPIWGTGLALLEDYEPIAAFFSAPVTRDQYWALKGKGAYRGEQRLSVRPPTPPHRESVLLSYSKLHRQKVLSSKYPGKVRSLGSTIAHLCYAAAGNCDATLLTRVSLWDVAPGLLMLRESGGELRYINGDQVSLKDMLTCRAPALMIGGHPEAVRCFDTLLSVD
ncbi:MAG: inositol monophosphatase family protein [Rhodothermaceae bacterium]|nr:inositol monophosphatase family protein [Rhodothermaceae bacterium]MYF64248.1 inositol monophosphatase family protein [Rhodothermaceae bacterium]MYI84599.1 inositol monophosphatase family protein [Rhodothermaceae bacterium]